MHKNNPQLIEPKYLIQVKAKVDKAPGVSNVEDQQIEAVQHMSKNIFKLNKKVLVLS